MVKPILLIGMMGCGKSTLGQMLAKRLGRAFIDLDGEIERREGRSIPDIFAAEGDAGFRKYETAAVSSSGAGWRLCSFCFVLNSPGA